MLEAIELECIRGERRLFSGLSFTLGSGELLRVVGANGSGKTSLLRIMRPTPGSCAGRAGQSAPSARNIRAISFSSAISMH